jgi:transcriptional regulator with XRE-family HTH domain
MALGKTQHELGLRFGVSKRTVIRWEGKTTAAFSVAEWRELAAEVHPHDPGVAREIAEMLGHTLASLGITPAVLATAERVDRVVLAAAEAGDVSPVAVRRALAAALDRAAALGLSLEELRKALAAGDARRRAR